MSTPSSRVPLIGALLLYFLLATALLLRVNWGAAPDEAGHAEYIQSIATTHSLPLFTGASPPDPGNEFHQPPLYYLLASPIWAVLPAGVQNYSVRALSMVFGLLTIWVIWNAANLVFGRGSRATVFCTLGAALLPLHQGIGASVNNDSLAGLLSAFLFYLIARAWLEAPTRMLVIAVGVVAGLGALTKLTVLPLGACAFLAVGAALAKRGERPITALLPGLIVALVLVSPMLIRNQSLYGDPFAYGLFSKAAQISPGFSERETRLGGMSAISYWRGTLWQILGTTWGFWGGPNSLIQITRSYIPDGPRLPDPLWLFPLSVVVFGPLMGIWEAWSNKKVETETAPDGGALLKWWSVGVSLVLFLWVNFAFSHIAGGQARYLHPALLPVTLLVGGGLSRSRAGFVVAVLMAVTMLGLTLANILEWKTLV